MQVLYLFVVLSAGPLQCGLLFRVPFSHFVRNTGSRRDNSGISVYRSYLLIFPPVSCSDILDLEHFFHYLSYKSFNFSSFFFMYFGLFFSTSPKKKKIILILTQGSNLFNIVLVFDSLTCRTPKPL